MPPRYGRIVEDNSATGLTANHDTLRHFL
jgi:hypothetical protein